MRFAIKITPVWLPSSLTHKPHLSITQCDQIRRNFTTLAKLKSLWQFFRVNLVFVKILNQPSRKFYAFGQIFIVVNHQILNKYCSYLVTLLSLSLPSSLAHTNTFPHTSPPSCTFSLSHHGV